MISVLILTKNEENDLSECLTSVSWCDDVHVFDSFSQDKTIEIARKAGVNVVQREFDNYANQRNAALNNIGYKYNWIMIVDADERIPNQLVGQLMHSVCQAADSIGGFRIRRRDYMGNTWLKHSQMTPRYIRLIRKGKANYHRDINEVIEVDGKVEDIDGHFDHYPFSKGLQHWLNKHNQYSSMEAKRWIEEHSGVLQFSLNKALFSEDFSEKRYHLKGFFYKIPARPVIKWLYLMFWRLSFLDGRAGLTNATLQAIYEYFIVLKTKEILSNK